MVWDAVATEIPALAATSFNVAFLGDVRRLRIRSIPLRR
jgi:hypothetical protein